MPRIITKKLLKNLENKSILLLGPRQTGKSALIRHEIKGDKVYNLLDLRTYSELSLRPTLIRESLREKDKFIIIDEIQRLPILMEEIHLMIEELGRRFLLTGSSARKLRRTYTKLMAGRARVLNLHPLVYVEKKNFDLFKTLTFGSLPSVYLSQQPAEDLMDYVGEYLREEIAAEALTRGIESYSRFLTQIATANASLLNIEKIANDAQMSPTSVRRYIDVLSDTLIADLLEPFHGPKRKAVSAAKLYFFDIGVVNHLLGVSQLTEVHPAFGLSFETFIYQELIAYRDYRDRGLEINFWRTHDKHEVDFIINKKIAIEVKATKLVSERDLTGLFKLAEEVKDLRKVVVSRDQHYRKIGDVEIFPYEEFLSKLWDDKFFS